MLIRLPSTGKTNPNYDPYFHPDQEWKSQIFKKLAPQSQFNTNISGGTNSIKYFVSLGALTQGGLFKTDYMPFSKEMDFRKDRYNLRSNLDFDVNKNFKVSVDLGTQFVKISGMDNDGYTWEKTHPLVNAARLPRYDQWQVCCAVCQPEYAAEPVVFYRFIELLQHR